MVSEERTLEEREKTSETSEGMKGQYTCRLCGRTFPSFQSLASHMKVHKREKEVVGVGGEGEESNAAEDAVEESLSTLPPPPEVEVIEKAIEFLKERLPQVYGIERYDRIIVNSLKEDPRPLMNPTTLHAFIKSIAPRAYDSHISVHVINPLYARFPNLPQAVAKYFESAFQPIQPYYNPYYAPYNVIQPYNPYYAPYNVQVPNYTYTHIYPYQWYNPVPPPIKPLKTYKIVVDGQEIETDESGFMAWQRFLKDREEHDLRMKKLEVEIKKMLEEGSRESKKEEEIRRREDELKSKLEELSKKLDEERERRHQAELEIVKRELEELKRRPSIVEEIAIYEEIAKRLGFHRGGKTTIDILESLVDRIDQRAAQILSKIPAGGEWKPEIKRSPSERARKAEEIMRRLEKTEDILKAEDELIIAAAKVKPRVVVGGETEKKPS
ncbi:MAG: C2H2-type zinc finger protein [Thermoproteota archaeon]